MGKYKLVKTIGKGNFAKVKLARHMPTGQEVWKERERKGTRRRRRGWNVVLSGQTERERDRQREGGGEGGGVL